MRCRLPVPSFSLWFPVPASCKGAFSLSLSHAGLDFRLCCWLSTFVTNVRVPFTPASNSCTIRQPAVMSSDTALVSGQGSGIGWQVNLPSFSSLALNLGVAALKQLATAGVSEHTLQCMLMIAEVCPASNEYRRDISKCRREQRKTAIWMCKIVELGTATNFVADELLKTRAGENVVALMSAVLPVMSEHSCDSMILRLFDASGASSKHHSGLLTASIT